MEDSLVTLDDAETLRAEIDRLRSRIASLEAQITELDSLAHRDQLVDLPNRRSFVASLERLIASV